MFVNLARSVCALSLWAQDFLALQDQGEELHEAGVLRGGLGGGVGQREEKILRVEPEQAGGVGLGGPGLENLHPVADHRAGRDVAGAGGRVHVKARQPARATPRTRKLATRSPGAKGQPEQVQTWARGGRCRSMGILVACAAGRRQHFPAHRMNPHRIAATTGLDTDRSPPLVSWDAAGTAPAEFIPPACVPVGTRPPPVAHQRMRPGLVALPDDPMNGRLIIIGDIHGCHQEFADLLNQLAPVKGDRIILLGDLVNRGPDSLRVLDLARASRAIALLGNHELRLLKAPAHGRPKIRQGNRPRHLREAAAGRLGLP